jgi:ABC-2 type transport system ATP-binding protein
MHAIESQNLTKRFRRIRSYRDLALYRWQRISDVALEDVSLEVRKGELFGLLGENGAGKTTLIRLLTTTLLPTSGRAAVLGHDVVRQPDAVRRLIGVVSGDERTFYWRLSGRQNLRYFAALHHVPAADASGRIERLMTTLGVESYADRPFATYSTGIRQKFAITRGMLTEPRVLFMDEPTRALDPIAADDLRLYVRKHIVDELGCTVLLATHSLSEAESICDRVAIIRHGKVLESGSMHDLGSRIVGFTSIELAVAGVSHGLREALCAVHGVEQVEVLENGGHARVTVRIGKDGSLNRVLSAALASGVTINACTTQHASLDDIYRAVHATP